MNWCFVSVLGFCSFAAFSCLFSLLLLRNGGRNCSDKQFNINENKHKRSYEHVAKHQGKN